MTIRRAVLILGVLGAAFTAAAQTSEGAFATPAASPSPAPSPSPAASAGVAPLIGDAVAGKDTFTQHCSVCHGVAAAGFIGPTIAGVNWSVAGLHAIVRQGIGGYGSMPAFNADVVTDKDIANIAAFLLTLAPPVAPASKKAMPVTSSAGAASVSPTTLAAGDPVHGHQIYTANCAACHGASGQGGVGPSLHGEKARKDTAAAIAWIKNPVLPMPKLYPGTLSEKDVDDVAAFVESL